MKMSSYPYGTSASDPDAPWNAPDPVKGVWDVTVTISLVAYSDDEAVSAVQRALVDAGDIEKISANWIEEV